MAQCGTGGLGNTKPNRIRSRAFCITLNNYNEEEYLEIKTWAQRHSISWIFGKEVGASGTPHIQGYMKFKNPTDFNSLKALVSGRLHIEKAKGNMKQNFTYCSKDGNYEEFNMGFKIDEKKNAHMEYIEACNAGLKHMLERFPDGIIYMKNNEEEFEEYD